ncbi:terminase large subunit [bacterium]|nr:terminase large subunit [bacterium]
MKILPSYDPWRGAVDYVFDEPTARRAISFFSDMLTHVEGRWAGNPFKPESWQQAIIGNLFGWRHKRTGVRRYREAFVYVPRKNGKTNLIGGTINYIFHCDNEPGAQIYLAAAERDQASLCFNIAAQMNYANSELLNRCDIYPGRKQIVMKSHLCSGKQSEIKAISADANTKHGFNIHAAVIDELHAQPNRDLVDVLQTGTVSRVQPIIFHVTTADFDRPSICNEKHDYACKVRDGIIDDPSFLPAIWEATINDDWKHPDTWRKANPNFDVSIPFEYMQRECQKAQDSPAYENTFKRLHLNIKTQQDVRWLSMDRWDKSDAELPVLDGKPCIAGLDLASTSDLSALVLFFPSDSGPHYVVPHFWLPMDTATKRDREDRVPYLQWINQGFLRKTDGNVTDYDIIRRDVNELRKKYNIKEIAFDPWNATQLANQLSQDGFELVKYGQSMANMNEPSKRLEKLIGAQSIAFGRNPVLRWMASNVTVMQSSDGHIRPDKKKSTEKIDGIVALIMAIGRWIVSQDTTSVYQKRGIITL